ncbi:hypothetical protein FS837_012505 [Tulasnella sp. UAMH 9824]|nr:hypothetical protein FS837_012505 [Tulasnella sp. UAMH 9824]
MTLYPQVQARAREEVDRMYGEGYPQGSEEQEKLPFIHAVVLESMRWNPPVSTGLPHASREDDIYEGYFIPKGTTVIGNLWQISRDPSIYKDPSTFNPNRFIDDPDVLDPREFIFGFGRRICPGNYLGYQLVWTFIVSLLWGFEMRRPERDPPLDDDLNRFDLGLVRSVGFAVTLPA